MMVHILDQGRFRNGNLCGSMLTLMERLLSLPLRKRPQRYLGHHSYFKPNGFASKYIPSARTFSFEEGLGTYGTLAHHVRVARREGMKFPFLKFFIRKALGSKAFVDSRWTPMLFESDDDLLPLKTIFSAFPGAFHFSIQSDLAGPQTGKTMLFFTAPLVELGILSRSEYANLLRRVTDAIAESSMQVVFKPHPLERNWNDEFPCVRTDAPSEVVIPMVNPQCVGGFSTGALITARLIFKLESFSFNAFLPQEAARQIRIEGPAAGLFARHVTDFQSSAHVYQGLE